MTTTPMQPDSNERDVLRELLPGLAERDLPSDRRRQLQEFLMSEFHQDLRRTQQAPRRAPRRRLVFAMSALAVVAVTGLAVTAGLGDGRETDGQTALPGAARSTDQELSPLAHTVELAATTAAAKAYTPPRPDQWIYIQNRELAPGSLAKDKGQNPDVTVQNWVRVDGKKMATINPDTGKLDISDEQNEYPTLAALPTDPQELISLLREQLKATPDDPNAPRLITADTPEEWDALLFRKIAITLDGYLLPPDVTAGLWRASALVPGVTQSTVEVDGREVIAVGRIQEGWRFEQLLLDPDTHDFVGYRSVAVKDFTYDTGPTGTVTVKKGEVQFETIRLAATVVDAAGHTG